MGILNPVVSKFTLVAGVAQEIYSCPVSKTHAIVDLSFYKDNQAEDLIVGVALTTESNPANLTSVDYFIDDIELAGIVNTGELNKVVVGSGERLYIKVMTGPDLVVRMSGVEEFNPKVLNAGRLVAASISGTTQTQIYDNSAANVAYTSCSITIFNTSPNDNAEVQAWITSSSTPGTSDKVIKITIPFNDTTIIENVLLAPGEKVFIQSDKINTEYFINGIVTSI